MGQGHEGVAALLSTTGLARARASAMRRWSRRSQRCPAATRTSSTAACVTAPTPEQTPASLGLVRTSVLAGILRTEHGLGEREVAGALERALLVAGYERDSVLVAGADALDIIDAAMP